MLFPRLRQLARARGYHKDRETVYGLENGIPFAFGHTKNYQDKIARIYVGKMSDEQMEQVETFLRQHAAELGYHRYRVNEGEVMVFFTETWKSTPLDTLMRFTDTMRDFLVGLGLGKETVCFECQQPCEASNTYLQGTILYYAHETCLRKRGMQPEKKGRHEYVKPTMYTICGAFVAAAAAALLMILSGYDAIILSVIISFAAITVYQRTYGPRTWQGLCIVLLSILFATMVMVIGYYESINLLEGYEFSISHIGAMFRDQRFLDLLFFAELAAIAGAFLITMFKLWRESKEVAKPKKVHL